MSKGKNERIRALRVAKSRRDASYLREALSDPDTRTFAARYLGDIDATEAIPAVTRLIFVADARTRIRRDQGANEARRRRGAAGSHAHRIDGSEPSRAIACSWGHTTRSLPLIGARSATGRRYAARACRRLNLVLLHAVRQMSDAESAQPVPHVTTRSLMLRRRLGEERPAAELRAAHGPRSTLERLRSPSHTCSWVPTRAYQPTTASATSPPKNESPHAGGRRLMPLDKPHSISAVGERPNVDL